jgi:hypothetical protein
MTRGYYTRTVLVAYDWQNGTLTKRWTFDSSSSTNSGTTGQGNHSLSVADVDNDGKDEIIFGAMTVDDNGALLYNTSLGHGDAMHVGDLNPNRSGLEVFKVMEDTSASYGAAVWDAATGSILWGVYTGADTGRGMSADIDPNYAGEEVWASSGVGLRSIGGTLISSTAPSAINFGIWWDGDLLREVLDHTYSSSILAGVGKIYKWDYTNKSLTTLLTATGTYSNNTTKGTPNLQADLIGDWREEVIWRTEDSTALRLYTTTDTTSYRFYTLMHDPVYRLSVAWQNVGYNQPPHTSFYLGNGMATPSQPSIYTTSQASIAGQYQVYNPNSGKVLDIYAKGTANGTNVQIYTDNNGVNQIWNVTANGDGTYKFLNPNSGKVLDVASSGTADGTNVQIYTDNSGTNQKWWIVKNSDGTYKITSALSGKALDVANAGTANGTNVQIWTDIGGTAQKWRLLAP